MANTIVVKNDTDKDLLLTTSIADTEMRRASVATGRLLGPEPTSVVLLRTLPRYDNRNARIASIPMVCNSLVLALLDLKTVTAHF